MDSSDANDHAASEAGKHHNQPCISIEAACRAAAKAISGAASRSESTASRVARSRPLFRQHGDQRHRAQQRQQWLLTEKVLKVVVALDGQSVASARRGRREKLSVL